MAEDTPEAEQLMIDYATVWNERAYVEIPDVVAESFVMYDPLAPGGEIPGPPGEVHGPDGLAKFIRLIVSGFPDFHVDIREMRSGGDVVMYEGEITMSHEGSFYGIPATGRGATFRYMGVILVEDGKVFEHRVYHDLRKVAGQVLRTVPAVVPLLPRIVWNAATRRVPG